MTDDPTTDDPTDDPTDDIAVHALGNAADLDDRELASRVFVVAVTDLWQRPDLLAAFCRGELAVKLTSFGATVEWLAGPSEAS